MPRFINSKVILLRIFTEKAEHEHQVRPLSGTFLERHDEFDKIIKDEKKRIKKVRISFFLVDVCIGVSSAYLIAYNRHWVISR